MAGGSFGASTLLAGDARLKRGPGLNPRLAMLELAMLLALLALLAGGDAGAAGAAGATRAAGEAGATDAVGAAGEVGAADVNCAGKADADSGTTASSGEAERRPWDLLADTLFSLPALSKALVPRTPPTLVTRPTPMLDLKPLDCGPSCKDVKPALLLRGVLHASSASADAAGGMLAEEGRWRQCARSSDVVLCRFGLGATSRMWARLSFMRWVVSDTGQSATVNSRWRPS